MSSDEAKTYTVRVCIAKTHEKGCSRCDRIEIPRKIASTHPSASIWRRVVALVKSSGNDTILVSSSAERNVFCQFVRFCFETGDAAPFLSFANDKLAFDLQGTAAWPAVCRLLSH